MSQVPRHLNWEPTFDLMTSEWQGLDTPSVDVDWDAALAVMLTEMADLKRRGEWRTGKRTLLGQLGINYQEVLMCKGLAWLLSPDAWHGLGDLFLLEFLGTLGLPEDGADRAVVVVEESRGDTRADLVVRFSATTVVLEAKIFALEQPQQADRLAMGWADEDPTLVFLTPAGRMPQTAVASAGQWRCLSWSAIADMAERAVSRASNPSAGALDLVETLRRNGG